MNSQQKHKSKSCQINLFNSRSKRLNILSILLQQVPKIFKFVSVCQKYKFTFYFKNNAKISKNIPKI